MYNWECTAKAMFSYPYNLPNWVPGIQILPLGHGGSAQTIGLTAMKPQVHPTVYNVRTYGMGTMPRQIWGQRPYIDNNNLSNPSSIDNLMIRGLSKPATG